MIDEWEKTIGLADMHGTVARVNFVPGDGADLDPLTHVSLQVGGANVHAAPTPEALRRWAAALLDGADAMEAGE